MTDRELLELAAKAAGYDDAKYQDMEGWGEVRYGLSCGIWSDQHLDEYWNPLQSDGDALRLAASLEMVLGCHAKQSWAQKYMGGDVTNWITIKVLNDGNQMAAVRSAITQCAATIGKEML